MVTIRFLHYTTYNGVNYRPGQVVSVPVDDAVWLVNGYRAVYDGAPPTPTSNDPYPQYVKDVDLSTAETAVMGLLATFFPTRAELAAAAFLGDWASIAGKPAFAPVAFTGDYADLVGSPPAGGGSGWSAAVDPGNPNVLVVTITDPGGGVYVDPGNPNVLVFS